MKDGACGEDIHYAEVIILYLKRYFNYYYFFIFYKETQAWRISADSQRLKIKVTYSCKVKQNSPLSGKLIGCGQHLFRRSQKKWQNKTRYFCFFFVVLKPLLYDVIFYRVSSLLLFRLLLDGLRCVAVAISWIRSIRCDDFLVMTFRFLAWSD